MTLAVEIGSRLHARGGDSILCNKVDDVLVIGPA